MSEDLMYALKTSFPSLRDLHINSLEGLGKLLDDAALRTAVGRGKGAVPVEPAKTRIIVKQDGKSVRIPRPVIVIDSREQAGKRWDFFRFPHWIEGTTVRALRCGDYSVLGMENRMVVERKTLSDMVSSLTAQRDRFIERCSEMEGIPRRAIVVEASLAEIKSVYDHSTAHPNGIFGSLSAIEARFGIPVVFASGASLAEEYAASFLVKNYTLDWLEENGYERRFIDGDI